MQVDQALESHKEVLVQYELVQDGQRLFARTNISDWQERNPSPRLSCKVFNTSEEARGWYQYQRRFDVVEGNGCLQMRFLHSAERRALFAVFHLDLDEWLKETIDTKRIEVWLTGQSWWDHIRNNFIGIFQPIMIGLQRMHEKNKYHGNLSKGIVLRRCGPNSLYNVRGFLYDMQEIIQDNRPIHPDQGKAKDFRDLVDKMRRVAEYPWQEAAQQRITHLHGRPLPAPPTIPEFHHLCMIQLRTWTDPIDRRWIMRPAMFWNVQERVKFLRAMHRLLYKHDSNYEMRVEAITHFKTWSRQSIQSVGLLEIYDHKPNVYRDPLSKILLWRNAQEHYNLNEPNVTCVRIHERFSEDLDFFVEALRAMTAILRSTDSRVRSHIPSFFEEMGW